jgi:hypothetical protein
MPAAALGVGLGFLRRLNATNATMSTRMRTPASSKIPFCWSMLKMSVGVEDCVVDCVFEVWVTA